MCNFGGGSSNSAPTIAVPAAATALDRINTKTSTLSASPLATQTFTASALDQFGSSMPLPTVTWSTNAGSNGTINVMGVFTAGAICGGPYVISVINGPAATGGKEGLANVTVSATSSTISLNNGTTGTSTNQFEFSGAWTYASGTADYMADQHWSSSASTDYYQVRFTGTQI